MRAIAVSMLMSVIVSSPVPAHAQDLSSVFRRVNASVVVIRTKEKDVADSGAQQLTSVTGVGSGVLVSADGKVMTAAHVVQLADKVSVEFLDGDTVRAQVISSEPDADVSLLQLDRVPKNAVVAIVADSDTVAVGNQVFVVGAPYGIGHTLSVGHITGRHQPNTVYRALAKAEFLQTDAAINQGNSGGPMFSLAGEVVGIVSHIISKSGGFEGLGFVVSSNMARRLLLEERTFWTGISGYLLSGNLAKVFNLPQPMGVLIQRVAEHSLSAEFGLRGGTMKATIDGTTLTVGGDIILESAGIPIVDAESRARLQTALTQMKPGTHFTVKVLREGQIVELSGEMR